MSHQRISDSLVSLRKPEKKLEQTKGETESEALDKENGTSAPESEMSQ